MRVKFKLFRSSSGYLAKILSIEGDCPGYILWKFRSDGLQAVLIRAVGAKGDPFASDFFKYNPHTSEVRFAKVNPRDIFKDTQDGALSLRVRSGEAHRKEN